VACCVAAAALYAGGFKAAMVLACLWSNASLACSSSICLSLMKLIPACGGHLLLVAHCCCQQLVDACSFVKIIPLNMDSIAYVSHMFFEQVRFTSVLHVHIAQLLTSGCSIHNKQWSIWTVKPVCFICHHELQCN
jgi:hypothetical protein